MGEQHGAGIADVLRIPGPGVARVLLVALDVVRRRDPAPHARFVVAGRPIPGHRVDLGKVPVHPERAVPRVTVDQLHRTLPRRSTHAVDPRGWIEVIVAVEVISITPRLDLRRVVERIRIIAVLDVLRDVHAGEIPIAILVVHRARSWRRRVDLEVASRIRLVRHDPNLERLAVPCRGDDHGPHVGTVDPPAPRLGAVDRSIERVVDTLVEHDVLREELRVLRRDRRDPVGVLVHVVLCLVGVIDRNRERPRHHAAARRS